MRNANGKAIRLLMVAMVGFLQAGCQSGPRWDWWRIGKGNPTDSSAVARTAGVELPSVAASRAEKTAPNSALADSGTSQGGLAPQFQLGVQAPAADSLASNAGSYPTTGHSTAALPGSSQSVGAPMNSGPTAIPPNVAMQGPYDPNSYAATHLAQAPLSSIPSPPSPQSPMPGVTNTQAPIYLPSASAIPSYGAVPGPSSTSSSDTFPPPPAYPTVTAPTTTNPDPAYYSENSLRNRGNEPATAIAVQPPGLYRPGGTSDYPGVPQASYSIATRPESPGTTSLPTGTIDGTGYPMTDSPSSFE